MRTAPTVHNFLTFISYHINVKEIAAGAAAVIMLLLCLPFFILVGMVMGPFLLFDFLFGE